jgi:hypothetical protein
MINKAHDLPFDEPLETYSSSEHFLHDQGIAPGIKGRIVPEGTVERKPRPESGGRGGRSQGGRGQGGRSSGGRSQSGGGGRNGGSGDSGGNRQQSASGEKTGDRPAKSRNRNRRRTRGGKPAAAGENG